MRDPFAFFEEAAILESHGIDVQSPGGHSNSDDVDGNDYSEQVSTAASWPKKGELKHIKKGSFASWKSCFVWLLCHFDGERASSQHWPTWICCLTTGHLASTQRGGGGTMFRGRQRSREGRRRQEDLLQTSKLHPSHHTQCLRHGRRASPQPGPCHTLALLPWHSELPSLRKDGQVFHSPVCQAPAIIPEKLGTSCTSDFFLQERPRSSQGPTCCELLTQPQTRAGQSPAQDTWEFLVPAFSSKILSTEHPPGRSWALSCLFCGRTFQELLRIIPQTLTDKGWRVGGKDFIN